MKKTIGYRERRDTRRAELQLTFAKRKATRPARLKRQELQNMILAQYRDLGIKPPPTDPFTARYLASRRRVNWGVPFSRAARLGGRRS